MRSNFVLVSALLGAAVPASTYAQNNVQVYGIVDTAIEHVTNANAAGDRITRMPNLSGGMLPSRIGFRGSEDLGNGLRAIFMLENGFSSDTGALQMGNRLFGRQAWVGLSTNWGTVTVGRNYSMLFNSFFDVDVIGPAQFSVASLDSYFPNARSDNSLAYRHKIAGATVGLTYSLGRDASNAGGPAATNCGGEVAGDSKACRNWSAMLRYDGDAWAVVVAYDKFNGGSGAIAAFSPITSGQSDTRIHIAGYFQFGTAKVAGGFVRRNNEGNSLTPRTDLPYVGISYSTTPVLTLDAQFSRLNVKNSANETDLILARLIYYLSKRTAIYGILGRIENDCAAVLALSPGTTAVAGGTQNGILVGVKHSF